MKLQKHGDAISPVEVTNIESKGFWILVDDRELYLDYMTFPWFLDAPVKKIINLKRESCQHLRWPDLDVDLTLEMIENPECFPLKSKHVEQVAEESVAENVADYSVS